MKNWFVRFVRCPFVRIKLEKLVLLTIDFVDFVDFFSEIVLFCLDNSEKLGRTRNV